MNHIEISFISNKDVYKNKINNKKNIKVCVPYLQLLTKYLLVRIRPGINKIVSHHLKKNCI